MPLEVSFELTFYGGEASKAQIDLYDVAQAMLGFHRSIALTTHLVLNNEIITQAPRLKGATIFANVPEEGSWKIPAKAMVLSSALYTLGTAPSDTAVGHLVFSAYDFVVKQSLGFHVDFDESLGESYESVKRENSEIPNLKEYRFDSLIDKCESSMRDLHRPIVGQGTAETARILAGPQKSKLEPIGRDLNAVTYDFVRGSIRVPTAKRYIGRISSYNANTFTGRIFIATIGFPITFRLEQQARTTAKTLLVADSLTSSTQRVETDDATGEIAIVAESIVSKSGRLKRLDVIDVKRP